MIVKVKVRENDLGKKYFVYCALLLSAQLDQVNAKLKPIEQYKVGSIIRVKIND